MMQKAPGIYRFKCLGERLHARKFPQQTTEVYMFVLFSTAGYISAYPLPCLAHNDNDD